ncbi:hypothetical protein Q3G72_018522 [Acer saccharum]|nr:hypothetical protein Q3G72_018522 [Acer saccharum]
MHAEEGSISFPKRLPAFVQHQVINTLNTGSLCGNLETLLSIYTRFDSLGLWEVFKLYGKVRDVYLSPKKSSRRNCFGFIRFETMEEATKVVKLVDGLPVFGWPIRAKMASFGWNSRRFSCSKQNGRKEFKNLPKMCIGEDWDSSVEVVKDNQICTVNEELAKTEKVWEMAWNNKDNEDEWLSKYAIGVLKEFANVSSVNHRLSSRGVPLKFWKAVFFMKLGWLISEPVLVEQETLLKERFDRGRILVLIPLFQSCPSFIKVSVGDGPFFVKVSEEAAPVEPAWMEGFLGLSKLPSQAVQSSLLLEREGSTLVVDHGKKGLGRRNDNGQKGCTQISVLTGLDHQLKHCLASDKVMKEGKAVNFIHFEDLGDKVVRVNLDKAVNDKVFQVPKAKLFSTHQMHNQGKDSEVGGVVSDFCSYPKLKGEMVDGKRAIKKKKVVKEVRCGKSCKLRWLNYLRLDIKRGNLTPDEQDLIIRLHRLLGNMW